jgi:hypothetical protein
MFPFNSNIETLNPEDISAIRALYGWAPQSPIPDIGTDASPALCACGGTLVMAWKGIGRDDNIWVSRSTDGRNWTPQQIVPGAASDDGPTLAWDGTTLWLAIRGVPGDDALYWATSRDFGNTWSAVSNIPGTGSSNSPSMTIFQGQPLMVWKGIPNDNSLYYATWNNNWGPQTSIPSGSADRPSVCVDFTGLPRMVWRGSKTDDTLWTSTLTGAPPLRFWQPQQNLEWIVVGNGAAGSTEYGIPGSAAGPSITASGGKMFLAWQGIPGDDGIYFTQAAPGPGGNPAVEWSTQAPASGFATSGRPAIASFSGRVFLAWKGANDDHSIYTSYL